MKNTFHAVFTAALFALACTALHGQTSYSTTLTNAISPSQTANVCLGSNTGVTLPSLMNGTAGSYFKIDSESVQVTAANAVPGCYNVRRGVFGTSPALHAAGAAVAVNPATSSTGDPSRPVTGLPTQGGTNANGGASSGGGGGGSTTTDASQLITGTLPFARLPIGTTANTVPAGNDARFSPASTLTISKLAGVTGGCDPNTGIKTGGGACTDGGTAAINTAIASLTRPLLVNWDIGIGTTGIVLGTQGQIAVRCLPGAGVFVVNGSNSSAFYMSHATNSIQDGLSAASTQGSNLEISGCIVNGNRNSTVLASSPNFPLTNSSGTDPHGNASGDAAGLTYPWLFGIHVSNMQNVLIQGNTCIDTPTYCMIFDNVQHASVLNNRIFTKSFIFNQDPVHLNGYTSDFNIRGNFSDQGDDAVALNAPEGYAGSGAGSGISNIRISDENWFNSWNGIRIYAGSNKLVDKIVLSNIVGHAQNNFMKLGGEGLYGFSQGQLGNISVANTIFKSDASPFVTLESARQLNLNGVSFLPSSAPSLFEFDNATSNIQTLNIASLDPGGIAVMASTSGNGTQYTGNPINGLQSIVGTGVQNTGLSIPDARIGNNTTFISDGSGSGCGIASLCWKSNSISQQVLPGATLSGPVQKWLMNEGSGTTFADSSGHANTLTATNVTFTTQTGVPGLTATFDGSTSSAIAANSTNTNFDGSTPFTVSFWGKITSAGLLTKVIMGNQAASLGFYIGKVATNDHIYVDMKGTTGSLDQEWNYSMSSGAPDNILVSYNGSRLASGLLLFVNGVQKTVVNVVSNTLTGSISTTNPWNIGTNAGAPYNFPGSIADVRIWSRLLSSTEISALYSAGAQ